MHVMKVRHNATTTAQGNHRKFNLNTFMHHHFCLLMLSQLPLDNIALSQESQASKRKRFKIVD